MGILDNVIGIGGIVGDLAGAIFGSHSAHEANRTNIKNAREQRAWEERLANTAVQRRKSDIEAAGGNPALAFTTGAAASTPSVATPTVEPTFRPEWTKGMGVSTAMALEQMRALRVNNLKTAADARLTDQQARIVKVDADAKERYGTDLADWNYQGAWQDLQKKINDNLTSAANRTQLAQQIEESKARIGEIITRTARTASERARLEKTTDFVVRQLATQARKGELDLQLLERMNGLGGETSRGILKTIIDIWRTAKKD